MVNIVPGPEPSDDDIELLRYVRMRPEPVSSASDIEPKTDVGYTQTRNRLDQLADEGLLHVKKVGTTNIYWLTDEGLRALAESDT